jgi:hypothetical protein
MAHESGPITTIIRVPRTWWGGEALFVSVDGEHFYPVEPGPGATLGEVFDPSPDAIQTKDGAKTYFMSYSKRGVLHTTEGYWQGRHDYTIDSI